MKKLGVLVSLVMMSACALGPPPSTVGLYGSDPVAQKIPGSNAQAILFRIVEFNRDETFEATKSAMLALGYNIEEKDKQTGKITANIIYECGGNNRTPVTTAVYIQQVNNRIPETKFTIVSDRHSWVCHSGGEMAAASDLATVIQRALLTQPRLRGPTVK